VIQAVEDLGELDNTLIIYISGDNGASAEGMLNGTPNEFTTFNGVPVPVKDQFLWYEFWGSDGPFRTMRRPGRGRWTRRSSGSSRSRRIAAERLKA
jgi:arylsulfatase A-like enzyme